MSLEALGMIETRGLVVSVHVIPRPHADVEMILPKAE